MATEYKLPYTGSEINSKLGKIDGLVEAEERLTSEIAVERARINEIASLGEGSTTGDAELIDIRVGTDGTTYASAGEAVRTQLSNIKNDLDSFTDAVESTNLLDESKNEVGYLLSETTGVVSASGNFTTTDFIAISDTAVLSFGENILGLTTVRYALYDSDKNYISGGKATPLTQHRAADNSIRHYFNLQQNGTAVFVRICFGNTVWARSTTKTQIENGELPTAYSVYVEPYTEIKPSVLPTGANGIKRNKTVVFLGDSIIGNYQSPEDYPSRIAEMLGVKAINGGFGGTRMSLHTTVDRQPFSFCSLADSIANGDFSSQYSKYASLTILNIYEHIYNLDHLDWNTVDYLVVSYGTNDWPAQVPIDNVDNPKDISTYLGAFRYGYEKLMSVYPHIKVIAVTPMYRFNEAESWDTETKRYNGKYLYDFGDALIEECKKYHIGYVDMYRESGVNAFTKNHFIADGTHPTTDGLSNIANIIAGKILIS